MTKHETDCACGIGAVRTRRPFSSAKRSKTPIGGHGIEGVWRREDEERRSPPSLSGWRRCRPDRRLPRGRVAVVGCGTSFHAAQTSGNGSTRSSSCSTRPRPTCSCSSATRGDAADARGRRVVRRPEVARDREGGGPTRGALRRGRRRDARGRGELLPHRQLHLARSRRSRRSGARTSSWLPAAVADELDGERLPVSATRALAVRRRGARLADRPGGCVEAARRRLPGRRGAPARGAPARAPRRCRRERSLLRARGRGPRGRARRRNCRRADRARLRRDARADAAPGRRHRPLPAADARPRGGAGRSIPT